MSENPSKAGVDLSRQFIEEKYGIPEIPLSIQPPGFYRVDLLKWSYKGILGKKSWDRQSCLKVRKEKGDNFSKWAYSNYTWNQFLGEINWIEDEQAIHLLEELLKRDILYEMRSGILKDRSLGDTPRSKRLPELERMVAWMRVGNRWAWWFDAMEKVPDPKYYPIPKLNFQHAHPSSEGGVGKAIRHIQNIERELNYQGIGHDAFGIMATYILYALGFKSEPPLNAKRDTWEFLYRSFDVDLLLRWPASYLGHVMGEAGIGKGSGFFVTPMGVTKMMTEMLIGSRGNDDQGGDSEEEIAQRKDKLCENFSEPCAGTADMILAASNKLWRGGPFWDVNSTIMEAGRAQLALYAPWFTQSYCLGNSLLPFDELDQMAREQRLNFAIERQRAIYAADDWVRKQAEQILLDGSKISSDGWLAQHIRHRAEARATRDVRRMIRKLEEILILTYGKNVEKLPEVKDAERTSFVDAENSSGVTTIRQQMLFSDIEMKEKMIEGKE